MQSAVFPRPHFDIEGNHDLAGPFQIEVRQFNPVTGYPAITGYLHALPGIPVSNGLNGINFLLIFSGFVFIQHVNIIAEPRHAAPGNPEFHTGIDIQEFAGTERRREHTT